MQQQKNRNRTATQYLLHLMKGNWLWIGAETLLQILLSLLSLGLADIMGGIADVAVACHGSYVATGLSFAELFADRTAFFELTRPLLHSLGILVAVILVQLLLRFAAKRIRSVQTVKYGARLRRRFFGVLADKQMAAWKTYHTGELMNRLTSDVDTVVSQATALVPNTVAMFVLIGGAAVRLLTMAKEPMLIAFGFGLLMGLGMLLFRKHLKRLQRRVRESDGRVRSYLQESFLNVPVIKSFSALGTFDKLLEQKQSEFVQNSVRHSRFTAVAATLISFAFSAAYIAALGWGGFAIVFVEGFTYGSLITVLQLVSKVRSPLARVTEIVPHWFTILVAAERLWELEQLPDDLKNDPPVTEAEFKKITSVRLNNVCFRYEGETDVLHHADLTLNRGELLLLGGQSGIGKSTAIKLLLALYAPQSGTVTVHAENAVYSVGADTRKAFAYVPQGNLLFSGTVWDNVTLFRPGCSEQAVWEALRLACADEFLKKLPDGLNTVLGEGGTGISEGQAQRLAVARALLYDAPILLLDEATSALDEETERALLENLRSQGKTCLLISHRPGVTRIATRTLYLKNGSFIESL